MNRYKLFWNGKLQPTNGNTFDAIKQYVLASLSRGECKLNQFTLFDKWGQLKIETLTNPAANPEETSSYLELF